MVSHVYFAKVGRPEELAVDNDVTRWHLAHGWIWNVLEVDRDNRVVRPLGVFFATLLCGDGAVIHFCSVPGISIPPAITLAAFRKAIRMISPACSILLATIPQDRASLIRCAYRLGFRMTTGSFDRDGRHILLLKYQAAPGPSPAPPPSEKNI